MKFDLSNGKITLTAENDSDRSALAMWRRDRTELSSLVVQIRPERNDHRDTEAGAMEFDGPFGITVEFRNLFDGGASSRPGSGFASHSGGAGGAGGASGPGGGGGGAGGPADIIAQGFAGDHQAKTVAVSPGDSFAVSITPDGASVTRQSRADAPIIARATGDETRQVAMLRAACEAALGEILGGPTANQIRAALAMTGPLKRNDIKVTWS